MQGYVSYPWYMLQLIVYPSQNDISFIIHVNRNSFFFHPIMNDDFTKKGTSIECMVKIRPIVHNNIALEIICFYNLFQIAFLSKGPDWLTDSFCIPSTFYSLILFCFGSRIFISPYPYVNKADERKRKSPNQKHKWRVSKLLMSLAHEMENLLHVYICTTLPFFTCV